MLLKTILKRLPKVILKEDLEHGCYYNGICRNATEARWNETKNCFVYWRYKFGTYLLEEICHPADDHTYDVFLAREKLPEPTKEIPL